MTLSTTARDNALSCEAKKHAYRQTQDGVVVSFVLHPQEVPDALAIAPLGTRYALVVVELNDDDTPKQQGAARPDTADFEPTTRARRPAVSPDRVRYGEAMHAQIQDDLKPRHPVAPDKRLAQQAGIMCGDPIFHRFLSEQGMFRKLPDTMSVEGAAATAVRLICGVKSRSEIVPGTPAGDAWDKLMGEFEMWKRAT